MLQRGKLRLRGVVAYQDRSQCPVRLGWLSLARGWPCGCPSRATSRTPLPPLQRAPRPPQAVEKLVQGAESGCHSEKEKQIVLNCSRLLTRVLPYIFEDPDWRGFFWSTVPGAGRGEVCARGRGRQGGAGTGL